MIKGKEMAKQVCYTYDKNNQVVSPEIGHIASNAENILRI